MFIPLRDFGKYGVVHDTMDDALPMGVWSDARNVRFSGLEMEKMYEPEVEKALTGITGTPRWFEQWSSSTATYVAVATDDSIWVLEADAADSSYWRQAGSGYSKGKWQSFEWGDTVIFNNGVDIPQIYDYGTDSFVDLPRWGIISFPDEAADPLLEPSRDTGMRADILIPYKNFLVACGITENGKRKANTVWWSDATSLATYSTEIYGPPSWDYEDPGTLSGKNEVGLGEGGITACVVLNENVIIYTDTSATAMVFTRGNSVMGFRRLFNKGAAGMHCVVEFQNQHFVVSRDQVYIHDGSTVQQIAQDRVEDEFFSRVGAGGRFGDANAIFADFQVVQNPDRKEIYVIFDANGELL